MNTRSSRAAGIVLALCFLSIPLAGAPALAEDDAWQDLRPLAGDWKGEGSGFGVTSDVTHKWEFVLDEKFLRLRTRSTPREEEKSSEEHEDVGYLSHDSDRGLFVFRQFLSEGYVNTFDVIAEQGDSLRILFEYREAESAGGMKARMYVIFLSDTEYEMTLELAAPGKEFAPCQHMRMKRVE